MRAILIVAFIGEIESMNFSFMIDLPVPMRKLQPAVAALIWFFL